MRVDEDIVANLFPHLRRARLHGVLGMRNAGQNFVIDDDRFSSVQRLCLSFRNNHCDGFAHVPCFVGWEKQMRSYEDFGPSRPVQFHVEFCLGEGVVLDCAKFVCETIGARKHAEDAGHVVSCGPFDADDACMGMRRTDDRRVSLAGKKEVVAKLAAARQQPRIFVARHRLADEAEIWVFVGHRRLDCGTDWGAVDRKMNGNPTILHIAQTPCCIADHRKYSWCSGRVISLYCVPYETSGDQSLEFPASCRYYWGIGSDLRGQASRIVARVQCRGTPHRISRRANDACL